MSCARSAVYAALWRYDCGSTPQYRITLCYTGAVKPAPFVYHRPATIPETVALLAKLAPQEGRVLAGGQSLVPIMAFRLARPAHLIDINRVAGSTGWPSPMADSTSARGCGTPPSIARLWRDRSARC